MPDPDEVPELLPDYERESDPTEDDVERARALWSRGVEAGGEGLFDAELWREEGE